MPIERSGQFINPFDLIGGVAALKLFFLLLLLFYFVFSIIIFRQVQIMASALQVPLVPGLKFLAIVQVGVALAVFVIVLGTF